MRKSPYPVAPECWATTPIVRAINPLTGLILGDDSGYRKVRTLPANDSPLVVPSVLVRPSYDGVTEYGTPDPSIALAGGLAGGKLVVRACVARQLEEADRLLAQVTGGELAVCALDGFRSWRRQADGFTRLLRLHMKREGVTETNLDDRILDFIKCGNLADGTMSWVNADVASSRYSLLAGEIKKDLKVYRQILEYAATLPGGTTPENEDEALYVYITISANSGIGKAAGCNVPLIFEGNAHAGGGAVDIFLVDRHGKPVNIVPFDFPGPEAGIDFMEKEGSYEAFSARLDGVLMTHLTNSGVTHLNRGIWERFRDVNRIRYHLGRAMGWTFYSGDVCGENWHWEPGNIGYDARTGAVLHAEKTAESYPDSGNPGHALQVHGRDAVAVWGGASGHKLARSFGLEE